MAGEREILAAVLPGLMTDDPAVILPPGDDCAALACDGARLLLAAVDQVIADVHYGVGEAPEAIAEKLLKRNLSDIAAMGGVPRWALLALATAKGRDLSYYEAFYAGLAAAARRYGVSVVGGDLAALPRPGANEVASLTILGEVEREVMTRRDAAQCGEKILVTGVLGNTLTTKHHLHFEPRLAEGRFLAVGGWTRAMMDISDGLALELIRMGEASRVAFQLDLTAVPRREGATAAGALSDGEDYELLFTVAPERIAALRAAWPFATALSVIGDVVAGAPGTLTDKNGKTLELRKTGYEH